MEKSKLTLDHNLDCLRLELAQLTDQETRIQRKKESVLNEILRCRRQITEVDKFPEYTRKRNQRILDTTETQ